MQLELKRIQKQVGITFVYVTHDQEEALTMSDRVAVVANGRIEQVGPPVELYERPATEFVAGFIGISNLLTRDGVRFVVRPEKLRMLLEDDRPEPGMTVEPGVVEQVVYVGQATRYNIRLDGGEQLVAVRQNTDAADQGLQYDGRRIRLAWAPEHTFVLGETRDGRQHQGEVGRMRSTEGPPVWARLGTIAAAALIALTACGSNASTGGSTAKQPPTYNIAPPTKVGAGEGALSLIDWPGYVDRTNWQTPAAAYVHAQTACNI